MTGTHRRTAAAWTRITRTVTAMSTPERRCAALVWAAALAGAAGYAVPWMAAAYGVSWAAFAAAVACYLIVAALAGAAKRAARAPRRDHDLMRLRLHAYLDELFAAVMAVNNRTEPDDDHRRLQRATRDLAASLSERAP